MNRKPNPAVFLRAAELIDSKVECYACLAISRTQYSLGDYGGVSTSPEYFLFAKHYQPKWHSGRIWFTGPFTQWRRARALRRCAKIAAQLP